jgi:transcription termination factor Rho
MRMLDLVCPPGKGQRCLIVSPPAGRQDRAAAITRAIERNHPEAVLLVLLIDERPEEVTDRRRMVEGEVVSAPLDESPAVTSRWPKSSSRRPWHHVPEMTSRPQRGGAWAGSGGVS